MIYVQCMSAIHMRREMGWFSYIFSNSFDEQEFFCVSLELIDSKRQFGVEVKVLLIFKLMQNIFEPIGRSC